MKKAAQKTESEIIDVVGEFDYSTQNDVYNKRFIEWRRKKDNPYAYNFAVNKKESVFVDGQGFVNSSVSEAENETLSRILYVIGIALLAVTVIENVLGKVIIQTLDMLGFDIHNSFISSTIYGGSIEIVTVLICITLLKLAVPLAIIGCKFKMPFKLRYPTQLNDPAELIGAIAVTILAASVLSLPSAYSDEARELYSFFKSYNADFSVWGQGEFLVYTIFDIIVVSIFSEALFRGEMFTALRQFGDAFAIIITAAASAIMVNNLSEIPAAVIISAVAATAALRSGTIFTAISVKIIYKMYLLAITIIEADNSEYMFLTRNFFILISFIVSLAVLGYIFVYKDKKSRRCYVSGTPYLSMRKKLAAAAKTVPFAAAIAIGLVSAILSVFI